MSTTSLKADHGSVKSNGPGQSHSVSPQCAKTAGAPLPETGRSHQMVLYLDTCSGSGRPVSETLQDPSHVPGARCRINLDNPLYCTLSHDSKTAPPPHESLLTKVGAQFSDHKQGTVHPAELDLVDVTPKAS